MSKELSVEALLQEVGDDNSEHATLEVWIPKNVTFTVRGRAVPADIAFAILLDRLLGQGFMPAGFDERTDGRMYLYNRATGND